MASPFRRTEYLGPVVVVAAFAGLLAWYFVWLSGRIDRRPPPPPPPSLKPAPLFPRNGR